jgi:23S rRNA (guanine745-N1)-methyltransferase
MWACPHCRLGLEASSDGSSLVCANRHSFDRAREGYVNLLPANRKRSRDPGDNAQMVAARRRVHNDDTYRPLADAAVAELAAEKVEGRVLDLGCGEGYYTQALVAELSAATICGVDISRNAVRLAAKHCPAADIAVASAFCLPVADGSLNAIVRIFAPSDDSELSRVLKPGGFYLEVSPGPRHLWQLREWLYETPREHAQARADIAGMTLHRRRDLQYELQPEPGRLADIVGMTPFAHRAPKGRQESLLASGISAVTAAFSLRLFRRDS